LSYFAIIKERTKFRNIKTIALKSSKEILEIAKRVITQEAEVIHHLSTLLDEQFSTAVQSIYQSSGRLIITGIGKSANIANKIVATLNSTGQPAMFMHAADAIHGDLGMVQDNDIVLCISKSGNTPEIKVLVPLINKLGNKLIGMTSNKESFLAIHADFVFHAYAEKEACPNNLAPTTSTTAQLVLGDALAVALLEIRSFTSNDFAKYHPGGSLGKKLYLRVEELVQEQKPQVLVESSLQEVIIEISSKRLGAAAVLKGATLVGLVTDGDLRRMLQNTTNLEGVRAADIMTRNPKSINANCLAAEALAIMEENNITQLIVLENGSYKGLIHLHDILKEGIF
jgi:arabinose-5-phosphate isomerase